jgi:catechol 2,3-dioxygenase-like lactoylglutathione lyase family enzyme
MEKKVQPFNSLGHINLRTNDLQASIDFYGKLGFPEFLRLTEEDGRPWIVYLKITDEVYIELLPGGDGSRAGSQKTTGLNHLCLTTPDIEMTVAELGKVGVPLTAPLDPKRRGVDRNRGCWIADPDGNRIEIMEMAPDCVQYEAIAQLRAGKGPMSVVAPTRRPANA